MIAVENIRANGFNKASKEIENFQCMAYFSFISNRRNYQRTFHFKTATILEGAKIFGL